MKHSTNYRLGVIMTCECRFVSYDKCTTMVVTEVDNGGGCVSGGRQGVDGRSLYFLPSFSVDLKLL